MNRLRGVVSGEMLRGWHGGVTRIIRFLREEPVASRMWRTGGRGLLSQLLQSVVASSAPHGRHLRVLAAAAVSTSPLRFTADRESSVHLHGTAWRECEEAVVSSSSSLCGPRKEKDWRAAEAKLVKKICSTVKKRGEWGIDTVNELEKLKLRLRSKLLNKVLRQVDDPGIAHSFFQWAGNQPSFTHSLQTYHAIIEIMGAAQQFDAQTQLLQDMHRQGLQPNTSTFNIILLGFTRANSTDRVVSTFNQMSQHGWTPNAFTFKCVIRSLVWNARALEALSIYTKMVQFGYVPDNFTYNGLIEGLCKVGHVDEAVTIFQDMEDRGLRPDAIAHAALIKGLDTKGRIDEACQMFQEMTGKNLRTVVNTHKGVMGVFSKRHKGATIAAAAL